METPAALLLVAAVCALPILTYLLGYTARRPDSRVTRIQEWIQENWPDKKEAFKQGHRLGYQQGVLQARALEEEEQDEQPS